MEEFTQKRGIEQVKIAPKHPAANNVETVMKPLGKAMKIGFNQQASETQTLQSFLQTYRDTPHPSTGVAPGAMLFRDGYRSNVPRTVLSEQEVRQARDLDTYNKDQRKQQYNASTRVKPSNFQIGDQVLVRNFYKQSKFEPYFLPERFIVMDTLADGKIILVQSSRTGKFYRRHPNDLKLYKGKFPEESEEDVSENELLSAWREAFSALDGYAEEESDATGSNETTLAQAEQPGPRRSEHLRQQNPRYYNENFVNE